MDNENNNKDIIRYVGYDMSIEINKKNISLNVPQIENYNPKYIIDKNLVKYR